MENLKLIEFNQEELKDVEGGGFGPFLGGIRLALATFRPEVLYCNKMY